MSQSPHRNKITMVLCPEYGEDFKRVAPLASPSSSDVVSIMAIVNVVAIVREVTVVIVEFYQ